MNKISRSFKMTRYILLETVAVVVRRANGETGTYCLETD